MLFQAPDKGQFIVVIWDVDWDEPSLHSCDSEEEAIALVRSEYDNAPSPGEPGGNTYASDEVPNARISIAKIVKVTVI